MQCEISIKIIGMADYLSYNESKAKIINNKKLRYIRDRKFILY